MKSRIELLKKLRNYVQADQYTQYHYMDTKNGQKCYCSIGFLMNEVGVNVEEVAEDRNSKSIEFIPRQIKPLEQYFTFEELKTIQDSNDNERKDDLLELLDGLILMSDEK